MPRMRRGFRVETQPAAAHLPASGTSDSSNSRPRTSAAATPIRRQRQLSSGRSLSRACCRRACGEAPGILRRRDRTRPTLRRSLARRRRLRRSSACPSRAPHGPRLCRGASGAPRFSSTPTCGVAAVRSGSSTSPSISVKHRSCWISKRAMSRSSVSAALARPPRFRRSPHRLRGMRPRTRFRSTASMQRQARSASSGRSHTLERLSRRATPSVSSGSSTDWSEPRGNAPVDSLTSAPRRCRSSRREGRTPTRRPGSCC